MTLADDRFSIARSLDATRPWSGLVRRQLAVEAVRSGAAMSGVAVSRTAALAIVDGRVPDVPLAEASAVAASGWAETLDLLQALASSDREVVIDAGLLATVHWVLHRRWASSRPGHLRPGVNLSMTPPQPPDPIDAALAAAAEVRALAPFWAENASLSHAVELLLLARADGVPVVAAGRPTTVGDARAVLTATAAGHRARLADAEQRWFSVSRELGRRHLTDRMTGPCWDAAAGGVLTNAAYRKAVEVVQRRVLSEQQASRDLKTLVDQGLLRATGRTRDRAYRWNL